MALGLDAKKERMLSFGIWTWLAILKKEIDRLTDSGATALDLLEEDLKRWAGDDSIPETMHIEWTDSEGTRVVIYDGRISINARQWTQGTDPQTGELNLILVGADLPGVRGAG